MKSISISLLLFAIFIQQGVAQKIDISKLNEYFQVLEDNNKFMGSVAVAQNGEMIYSKVIGYSSIDEHVVADVNTKYRIGSISKTFTAVLVFKALEEKRLDLEQTIDLYFPKIKNAEKIKIKHLLNHRSGIHNFTERLDYLNWYTTYHSEEDMVDLIINSENVFEPDSKAEYSNSNYVLLTYIVEKCFEKSYAQLVQTYIANPLGLENTYLGSKIDVSKNESQSYHFLGQWIQEKETDISIPVGAGGIVSTPADLVKFSDALFNGKLLKTESLEQMMTLKDAYGMGLFQIPFYDKVGYGHTGGIDGFRSMFVYFPDDNISFAIISNADNYNINIISISVLSAVFGLPFEVPIFTVFEVTSEELDKFLGVYSSTQIPLKITISKDNTTLIAQGTGQPSFPLEAVEKNKFKFDQIGLVLTFDPEQKTMILNQGGEYKFTKEE